MWQALETALPLGGTIGVAADNGSIRMTATGRRVTYDKALWDTLKSLNPQAEATAAMVQQAQLAGGRFAAADQEGRAPREIHEDRIELHNAAYFTQRYGGI